MPITIERVLQDIRIKECTDIYFSDACLWWTHLESDLEHSTQLGIEYRKAIAAQNGTAIIFPIVGYTDPLGNPIKTYGAPGQWINRSKMMCKSFGKHGLKVFMKTHHQNCLYYFSNSWNNYNALIDRENAERLRK